MSMTWREIADEAKTIFKMMNTAHEILVVDSESKRAFRKVRDWLGKGQEGLDGRNITIDPYYSGYEGATGYIVSIQGTPPWGTLIVQMDRQEMVMLRWGVPGERTKYYSALNHPNKWALVMRILEVARVGGAILKLYDIEWHTVLVLQEDYIEKEAKNE